MFSFKCENNRVNNVNVKITETCWVQEAPHTAIWSFNDHRYMESVLLILGLKVLNFIIMMVVL